MKKSLTKIKNNFRKEVKMKKSLKIENNFGSAKIEKIAVVLVLLSIPAAVVFAATVSHPASQIIAGTFATGDFELQNDLTVDTNTLHVDSTNNRVGIGTTNPGEKLEVDGRINATTDVCVSGVNCLSVPEADTTKCATEEVLMGDGTCDTKSSFVFGAPDFTSLWINPSSGPISYWYYQDVSHTVGGNIDNYVVELECNDSSLGRNNKFVGGAYVVEGASEWQLGVFWSDLSTNSIRIWKGEDDYTVGLCDTVRVLIWTY